MNYRKKRSVCILSDAFSPFSVLTAPYYPTSIYQTYFEPFITIEMFLNMNVKSLLISSHLQLGQRTFAAGGVLDRLTSVWKPSDEQERQNQARKENTAPSTLTSSILQSEQQPSARQLTRSGLDGANVGSLWGGSFGAFAARFVERNPAEASPNPEAQK